MRAALTRRYGPPDVVRLDTMPDPVPGPGDLLVQVNAAGVSRGDARVRGLDVPAGYGPLVRLAFGWSGPRRPVQGSEFAGRVLRAAGAFAPGDRVMGIMGMTGGAHADRLVIAADGLVMPAPETLSDVEAAGFFFGGLTAAEFLIDKGRVQAGTRVLVNGATGAVGSAAVQIARHLGATVTARCASGGAALVQGLGADDVVDRTAPLPPGPFDVVLDAHGGLTIGDVAAVMRPGGRFLRVVSDLLPALHDALRPVRGGIEVRGGTARETRASMTRLMAIHAVGGYRPVIGPVLPFDRIAEAHAIAGSGRKRGNVVVTMD
jgi:NADPH:quinone reductase-like Zn-dependent oxidoreductase